MLFNSIRYACFLPLVLACYYLAPRRVRPVVLLLASYVFYASYNSVFLLLIIAFTAVNYGFGLTLGRLQARPQACARFLVLAVGFDIAVLAFYKYALFLMSSLATGLGWIGIRADLPEPSIFLPLGISFFTFEFIHYVIEVKRGNPPVRSALAFAVFAAFFPTQIAGPIKRYPSFITQLESPRRFEWRNIGSGLRLIILGLFKKAVLADTLAPFVALGFQPLPRALAPGEAWLIGIAFAMQIYFDFSGFTDIARGSARLLGYEVPQNFHRPYMATNPSEFWRRWHMSLSSWFRDYLYIPLGGRRRLRYRNLMITMIVGGLWHGANWTFAIWGAFHGALLVGYWGLRSLTRSGEGTGLRSGGAALAVVGWPLTFALVCIGWVFFRATTFQQALGLVGSMLGVNAGDGVVLMSGQRVIIVAIAVACVASEAVLELSERLAMRERVARSLPVRMLGAVRWQLQPIGYGLLMAATLILQPSQGPPFIYFHF